MIEEPNQDVPLLQVRDLEIAVGRGSSRKQPIVRGISFDVGRGELVGVVGESGSGKTLGILGVAGLVEYVAESEVKGQVLLKGVDLLRLSKEDLRQIQGNHIGFVFQKARSALNPTMRVGTQIAESVIIHEDVGRDVAMQRAVEALELVEIPRAAERARAYPHEFSGGMAQRAAIAMAIACRPALLIADEPTTALDATVQLEVLALIDSLRRDLGMGVVLVTHDLAVARRFATSIVVMYGGRIVERGPTSDVFDHPGHPYTWKLMQASPALDTSSAPLQPVPGEVPAPGALPTGCAFRTRCFLAQEACAREVPSLDTVTGRDSPVSPGILHDARCIRTAELDRAVAAAAAVDPAAPGDDSAAAGAAAAPTAEPAIRVKDVRRSFTLRGSSLLRRDREVLVAVDDVTFDVHPGEILGLVGESGSGKTTLASLIVRLLMPDAGEISVNGRNVGEASTKQLRALRSDIQMVFQDPGGSLNPRMTVGEIIAEPLKIRGEWVSAEDARRAELMSRVGLPASYLDRYPHELSGGQQQRVGIARALILRPSVLLLDEPTASLDVSIQAQVLDLLLGLQKELGLACVFISHDLALVRRVCHRVAVMYRGAVVELDEVERVFKHPAHPYTASLIAASTLVGERVPPSAPAAPR